MNNGDWCVVTNTRNTREICRFESKDVYNSPCDQQLCIKGDTRQSHPCSIACSVEADLDAAFVRRIIIHRDFELNAWSECDGMW